jgi:monoamine oxidase
VQYIARPSLLANIVKLNTQISTIEVDPALEKPITLTSTANETFHADSVICTLPLGVLQSKTVTFTPSLPPRIQKAISNLGVGVLEKLFIRFSEPWWLGPIQNAGIGIEFYRFTSLKTTKQVMPRGTLNFFSLARIHKPQPVFGVFISTDLAKYLVALPKEELKELLQTHYIPHLPNYTADNPACQILEIDSSTWSADPFSGFGSYTHIPVGSDTGDENMKILSEKIMEAGDGGIWFAGEHTADTEMIDGVKYTTMATVTAAYKTGERAANHVIRTHTSELLN